MQTQIKRKTILDSVKYPRIMYATLLIVSILLLFSFVNLVEKENKIKTNIIAPTTAFVIKEKQEISQNIFNISYLAYYSIVIMIVVLIFIVINKLKHIRKIGHINNSYIMKYYEMPS